MAENAGELPIEAKDVLVEWIGHGQRGFGSITHSELSDFFERECGLSQDHPGVLRRGNERKQDRFAAAFGGGSSQEQCRIMTAVLDRFPRGSAENRTRKGEMPIEAWIGRLEEQTNRVTWYVRIGRRVGRAVLSPLTIGWAGLAAKFFW